MKKIFLMVAVMIAAVSASFAQDFSMGARLGMNVADITGDSKIEGHNMSFNAGVVACFPLVDNVFLEPGVYFSVKGDCHKEKIAGDNYKSVINLSYLEIPINGVYKYEVNSNLTLRGHFGPYFGFGLFGSSKAKVNGDKVDGSEVKAFSSKGHGYDVFDIGLNFGCGIEFSACYLGVQYGLGLKNFSGDSAYKMRNNVFSVDFGINF